MRKAFVFVAAAALGALGVTAQEAPALRPVTPKEDGVVCGVVKLGGKAPRAKKLKAMEADAKCIALHKDTPMSEEVVADKDGNLKWACVFVRKGPSADKEQPAAKGSVTITQRGCRYEPHVFGVQTGQPIDIVNDDEMLHNIHAVPFTNKEFNFGQPTKGQKDTKTFDKEEIPVFIKCDVHPWMSAWALVLKHSFYSVTGENGAFKISGLAPGKYTIECWTEKYKSVTQDVEVKAGENKIEFSLTEEKKKD